MVDTVETTQGQGMEFLEEEIDLPKRHHWLIDLQIQLIKTKPLGAFGELLVLVLVLVALFAPVITKYGPNEMHGELTLQQPNKTFWLGTDALARDVYSRTVYGARVSLLVGLGAIGLSISLATIIGVLSGYFGGVFDTIVQRFVDAMMSIPWLVFMLTIMAILGPGMGNVILALGILGASGNSRTIRSAVIAIKESEYLLAARAIGCKKWVILLYHVLPNVASPIIVVATLGLGGIILIEAALSFLGFGVPPPSPSWGRALSGDGLDYMLQNPGLAIFPGLAIAAAVFGFNMFGDALRDLLDPRLRGTAGGRA